MLSLQDLNFSGRDYSLFPPYPSTPSEFGLEDDQKRHLLAKHPLSRALAGSVERELPCLLRYN